MSGLMHGIGDLGHALGDVGHALGDVGHVVGDHIPLVDHGHGIRLHYVQARDPDYEKAAAELILQLNAAEVHQGQLPPPSSLKESVYAQAPTKPR